MDVISVVCPNCRSRLSIQNVPGIQDKILPCPICKYKAKVSVYQIGQAGKGGQGASDEATRLPDSFGQQVKNDTGQMRVIQPTPFVKEAILSPMGIKKNYAARKWVKVNPVGDQRWISFHVRRYYHRT